MLAMVDKPHLRVGMSEAAARAEIPDHDAYADDFEAFVDAIMEKPRRSNAPSALAHLIGRSVLQLTPPRRHPGPIEAGSGKLENV